MARRLPVLRTAVLVLTAFAFLASANGLAFAANDGGSSGSVLAKLSDAIGVRTVRTVADAAEQQVNKKDKAKKDKASKANDSEDSDSDSDESDSDESDSDESESDESEDSDDSEDDSEDEDED